jgi:alkylation response protein AidB-like acyl-CoA dehydrogenase
MHFVYTRALTKNHVKVREHSVQYVAPEKDAQFLMFDLFRAQEIWSGIPAFGDFSQDLVEAVIAEGAKINGQVVAPTNAIGDLQGCTWNSGQVTTPEAFKGAFTQIAQGGWLGLAGNPEFGGQGMPKMLASLIEEMFWAANTSLYLYGTLTIGACVCIEAHGTPQQKALYLPKLYSGQWTGAMALTESHAGTDLGIMRSKATPHADGSYRISGTKIFITSGEHDLAENIVHLTLAKLPDAPAGTKGISLFIVPKFLPNEDASLGSRNAWASGSLEHKMGIRGSATSVINYDGATAYLLGEENQGLAAMFSMMNYERLSVGLQGLGAGEVAYQLSSRYAKDRLQGRSAQGAENPNAAADSLLVHPDVRRMLLTQRAYNEAGRAFALFVGLQLDLAKYTDDEQAQALSELLTPVAKAFLTDKGFEGAVMAQQVFGGHGYVHEWGIEQIVRDARIGQIYEGTNGVQALDLISRKTLRDGGQTLYAFIDRMAADPIAAPFDEALAAAFERLRRVTGYLVDHAPDDVHLAGSVSTEFLELVGHTIYAWLWARMATIAPADDFGQSKRVTAEFFFARLLPKTLGFEASICQSTNTVMALPADRF